MQAPAAPPSFDHLMFGGPDLQKICDTFASQSGVAPVYGGRHDVGGTHNALVGLGGARYLELIGPDPEAPEDAGFAGLLLSLPEPRTIMWAVAVPDLDAAIAASRTAGYDPGEIMPLARDAPDGTHLEWRVCIGDDAMFGIVPFLIEWGACPHPTRTAPVGCELAGLAGEHPDPDEAREALAALGVPLTVTQGTRPALVLTINTPNGVITLQ